MNIIPFRPSEKYLMIQLAPYYLLIMLCLSFSWLWRSLILDLSALLLVLATVWQMAAYASELYILTPRGFIICRGVFDKHIYYRSLSEFAGMQRLQPGLLRRFDLFNLRLGLSGPPAERLTLYGVDGKVLYSVASQLSQELDEQLAFMESHEWVPKTA